MATETRLRIGDPDAAMGLPSPQVSLDLNLTAQLMLDRGLAQLALVQHLQSNDEMRLLFTSQINLSELTIAQRLANIKITEGPLVRCCFFHISIRLRTQASDGGMHEGVSTHEI